MSTPEAGATPNGRDRSLTWLLVIVLALTAYRVLVSLTHGLTLYVDEAQYWVWAQSLQWGYYSKPPLIAVAIWVSTHLCGNAEPCVRATSLVAYPVSALFIYALTRRLYGPKAALFAGIAFITFPGVSLSSLIISTDVLLFLFWSLALYAFERAIETDRWRDWLLVGFASGLGLETKYTMGIFAVSALLYVLLDRGQHRQLRNLKVYASVALAALLFLPNILWNVVNGFPTLRHTADISNLDSGVLHWGELAEFLGSQPFVYGPLLFALFVAAWFAPGRARDRRWLLLMCFSLPFLGIISLQALFGRANANWAAPTYVAATVLVAGYLFSAPSRPSWRWSLAVLAVAVNLGMAVAIYHYDAWTDLLGIERSRHSDPFKRARGWDRFADAVAPILAAHPDARLLGDDRDLLSHLIYHIEPHPFSAAAWNPHAELKSHFDLTTDISGDIGQDFIYVTRRSQIPEIYRAFDRVTLLDEIEIDVHPDWLLRANVYLLQGFKGYEAIE
jgi:4-amino-4-deoxy-L-arabinose transferase-like glycosyltransferase